MRCGGCLRPNRDRANRRRRGPLRSRGCRPPRRPARFDEPPVQRLDEQGVRPERRGDRGPQGRCGGDCRRYVPLDVVAAAEQQRYENGVTGPQAGQGCRQERLVQLDVAEPDVQPRAQFPHPVQQLHDRAQRLRVAAAVRHGDEGGGVDGGGGARCGAAGAVVHGSARSVQGDMAELGAELGGDSGQQLRCAVERQGLTGLCRCRLRHAPMVAGAGCQVVAQG